MTPNSIKAEDILQASEKLFAQHPSPTTANLLKSTSSPSEIVSDALSTRPLVTTKTLNLIKSYLELTKSSLSPSDFLKRIFLKRPLMFCGPNDTTILRDYRKASYKDWANIGTAQSCLSLGEYLSYDEICISALVGLSSYTRFINSGGRHNHGIPGVQGSFIERGVVVGLVGCRFEILDRMESLFCIVGSGGKISPGLEEIWKKFYGVTSFPSVKEADEDLDGFDMLYIRGKPCYLNKKLYKVRMKTTAELFLQEAVERGKEAGSPVFANTVGLGLGVWKAHDCQKMLLAEAFVETAKAMGITNNLVLNFSYLSLTLEQQQVLTKSCEFKILFLDRDLASPLPAEYSSHLLVTSYAWDGNSFPGNEIYAGSLDGSGDPAANCCCTIFELHNPYINPFCDRISTMLN